MPILRILGGLVIAMLAVALRWALDTYVARGPVVEAAPPKLATLPAPSAKPDDHGSLWVGAEGADAYGYPTRHVNKAELLGLLHGRHFEVLDQHMRALHELYERSPQAEYAPIDALDAFSTADPALLPLLDDWNARMPQSAAAAAARGKHLYAVAWARRGGKFARDTSQGEFAGMHESLTAADAELARALALRPTYLAAAILRVAIASDGGPRTGMGERIEAAIALCPRCVAPYEQALTTELPWWGGSYEGAEVLVRRALAQEAQNPRLAVLKGAVDAMRCEGLRRDRQLEAALHMCDSAVAKAPTYWKALAERGRTHAALKHVAEARADFEASLRDRPQRRDTVESYAWALANTDEHELTARTLVLARTLDPADRELASLVERVSPRLVRAAWAKGQAGDWSESARLYGLVLGMDPSHGDARTRRDHAIVAERLEPEVQALATSVAAQPEDFALRQKLDALYLRQGRFDAIVAMWTEFIARHPDNARAYFERGGTRYHQGELALATDDAKSACGLGLEEACVMVRSLSARAGN
jgi:tetratricopeptide (TPR) repeat protein